MKCVGMSTEPSSWLPRTGSFPSTHRVQTQVTTYPYNGIQSVPCAVIDVTVTDLWSTQGPREGQGSKLISPRALAHYTGAYLGLDGLK
jgi:hypothetical protein